MSRVFANGPRDRGSIAVRVIPKTQKIVLDAAFLNTQHYKVRIEGKVNEFKPVKLRTKSDRVSHPGVDKCIE